MRQVAFFSVAPYERPILEQAAFPNTTCLFHAEPLSDDTLALARDAEVLCVFIYDRLDAARLAQLPALRCVVTRSTGYDHIDLAACAARSIRVCYVPSYGENTVAEHAFALLLALARQLKLCFRKAEAHDFGLEGLEGFDLKGKTLGVVGAGRIGLNAVRIGRGFGMDVLAYDVRELPELAAREGFRYVPLDALLARADVVTLHTALTPETRHLIDRAALARMKPSAILINTARGPVVDTAALCEALEAGRLAGAGLDVFEGEEWLKEEAELLRPDLSPEKRQALTLCHTLLSRDDVVLTPHSAFFTREGVARLLETSLENIGDYLAGKPCHQAGA
ncbi:MAG TPA: NAD(P)-dependent oxidoreductase [Oscillatoriaceae cyanobacterium]